MSADITDECTEPTKFRKKPVVVDAMQFFRANREEVAVWCGGRYKRSESKPSDHDDFAEWINIVAEPCPICQRRDGWQRTYTLADLVVHMKERHGA